MSKPVFLLSGIRSGSTLLRCILDSHSQICAPHELHLRYLKVSSDSEYLDMALQTSGLDPTSLKMMLWDSIYQMLLQRSGKKILVDKSPSNLWCVPDILQKWPSARFILLKRDPAGMVRSILDAKDGRNIDEAIAHASRTVKAVENVRASSPDHVAVSYEELVAAPEPTVQRVCSFLGVPYEPTMLAYGKHDHGPYVYGIGDWSDTIKAGVIQQANPERVAPSEWPELMEACRAWGYPCVGG